MQLPYKGVSVLGICSGRSLILFGLVLLCATAALAAAPTNAPARELSLKEYLDLVLERNESLQVRSLELQIARKRLKSEKGAFEPDLLLGYDHVVTDRENTAEQRRSTGVAIFEEKNNIYTTGIEGLVPTGAKVRIGYTLRDLRNNLQDPLPGTIYTNKPGEEYQSFAGISLTQPLLKNAWFPATMANVRLAGLVGDVAFQEYRRQLMLVITTAEASYWNLYLAQEQVRFFRESVRLSEGLVHDNEERFRAGSGSELEVLEAKAGLALRRTKLAEAQQKYFETAAQVSNLMSEVLGEEMPVVRAADSPSVKPVPEFVESGKLAFDLNPDYLAQTKKLEQENIRVAYAKNQRLPQLDLKGSYGLNGLGPDVSSSWEDVVNAGFPSWTAGVELNIPLAGNIKGRNDLDVARLRKQQALVTLQETENQILNSITTALRKMRSAQGSVRDYEQIVSFNQGLLETEMKRLEIGKVDSRRVLDIDAALLESKTAVIEAMVLSERARLELQLVQGTVLKARAMELTRQDLEKRTIRRLGDAGVSSEAYQQYLKQRSALAERSRSSALVSPFSGSGRSALP